MQKPVSLNYGREEQEDPEQPAKVGLATISEDPHLADTYAADRGDPGDRQESRNACGVDCLGPSMLDDGRDAYAGVYDHRRSLIAVLIRPEEFGEGRDQDNPAADAEQTASEAYEDPHSYQEQDVQLTARTRCR
jgi:hypothetical protein